MKLDEFRSGRVKNKSSMGLVLIVILMMCDENESEIGFGSFDVGAAAAAHGPSQHSQSAHFFLFSKFPT